MHNYVIETERLTLRPLSIEDCDAVYKWVSDEDVARYMVYPTYTSKEKLVEWLASLDGEEEYHFGFVKKDGNELIGSGSIGPDAYREGFWGFGYNFRKDQWGHGYATEATKAMIQFAHDKFGICRFSSSHVEANKASGHVMEKCGLHFVRYGEFEKLDGSCKARSMEYEGELFDSIIEKMRQEVIGRSNQFEEKTKGTKDEYHLYREHVQYVYKYVVMLARDASVDREVLELSALLHDISMTDSSLDRSKHNEYSSAIAERLLRELRYPEEKTRLVTKCILNHSSKRAQFRTTPEEEMLASADGLAHFDVYKNLYSLAHKVMGLNDEDALLFIRDKLTRDYYEIGDEYKHLVNDTYTRVMSAKTIRDILDPLESD